MEKPGIEPAPGLQCICLSLIQKTGKIQVNYIQVLVTTPNMEKTQKVFIYLFIYFFLKKTFLWLFSTGPGGFMICVFLRRPKGRRSNIALDLQFMQIFTNQKYS